MFCALGLTVFLHLLRFCHQRLDSADNPLNPLLSKRIHIYIMKSIKQGITNHLIVQSSYLLKCVSQRQRESTNHSWRKQRTQTFIHVTQQKVRLDVMWRKILPAIMRVRPLAFTPTWVNRYSSTTNWPQQQTTGFYSELIVTVIIRSQLRQVTD